MSFLNARSKTNSLNFSISIREGVSALRVEKGFEPSAIAWKITTRDSKYFGNYLFGFVSGPGAA